MEMLREGGFFAWLSLASAFVGVVLAVLQLVVAKRFDLVPMVVGGVGATVLLGSLAFVSGIRTGAGAAGGADPASAAYLMAVGVSEALNGAMLAFLGAIVQSMVASVAVLVRRVAARRAAAATGGGAS